MVQVSPRLSIGAALAAIISASFIGLSPAGAQLAERKNSAVQGRIDFSRADLPPATVEIDLSREIFSDLFGLGEAAVAGVLESLSEYNQTKGLKATELAAERLSAAREILQLAKSVVREVRVRVYDGNASQEEHGPAIANRLDQQVNEGGWDKVLKFRDGDESIQVALMRLKGSVLGVFVVAADGNDLVLVNVVCDVSPENVKKLTAAATRIGLEHGLDEILEQELGRVLN